MSTFDDYRDQARQGHDSPDQAAERDTQAENLEAVDQERRDRLYEYGGDQE